MKVDIFAQQLQAFQQRLAELYQAVSDPRQQTTNLLPAVYKELGVASEQLQVAVEELLQKKEELAATQSQLETEIGHHHELFESMLYAYLVTDADGNILEANRIAATLFNVPQQLLVDQPLALFIVQKEPQEFGVKLKQLRKRDWVQEWQVRLQPHHSDSFKAVMTVVPIRDNQGKLVTLRWVVRDINKLKQTLKVLESNDYDPRDNYPRHSYAKGETIHLEPHKIWLVSRGLVKLSTINENGEEMLVGLAGTSMSFSSSMTSLNNYQATALSEEVQLIPIAFTEIDASPRLKQALLAQINRRLKQTELLLVISGKQQVKERLQHFLLFLKQEIGQSVAEGTLLNVRLTHQELANACRTTRVTITRELGKLQQQGKIAFDSKHCIILTDRFGERT
ncbi:MAG: helix-turn-helix domain-containing protein [Symploca sp. SIO2E9]|nr:helix-turn-helix domain-containing protein [Symploca sp. SIO2E9]